MKTVVQWLHFLLRCRIHGLIKRLIITADTIAERGNKARTQPPQPLAPRPLNHAKKSPSKRSDSVGFAINHPKRTPRGKATPSTIGNLQFDTLPRNPGGQNCHKKAPVRSVTGMVKRLVIKIITPLSISGARMRPAIKPSTTLGRLAIISMTGFIRDFHAGVIN